jgi:hypothetical protein
MMKILTILAVLTMGMMSAEASTAKCEVSVLGKIVETLESDYSGPFANEKTAAVSILMDGETLNVCVISKFTPNADISCAIGKKSAKLVFNETTFDCTVE